MNRIVRLVLCGAVLGVAVHACSSEPRDELKIAGSSTVYKRVVEPMRSALEKYAGIALTPEIHGTGAGLVSLLEGRADVLLSSADLPAMIDTARALGWNGGEEQTREFHVARIHEERLVVIVNSSNPVDALSTQDLVGVLSGRIANWKDVGGRDLPIMVVVPEVGRATREVFEREIMKGVRFTRSAFDRQPTGKVDDIVRANASAIAVTAEAFYYSGHIKILDTRKVTRPLLLITAGRPAGAAARFIDFANGLGRRYWQHDMSPDFWITID